MNIQHSSVKQFSVQKVKGLETCKISDTLSIEEPLEIRLVYGEGSERKKLAISVTMRTPGNDAALAIGFLFTEGIIASYGDVKAVHVADEMCTRKSQNIVVVELWERVLPNLPESGRNFYTTSSCGVCGKASIQSIKTVNAFCKQHKSPLHVPVELLYQLPQKLRAAQGDFAATGGLHASGLFTKEGELIMLKEDVGRHNALDKLIGAALEMKLIPLNEYILLLSGRASFELIQKAAMAGISIVAAIGMPSSLAVELAMEFEITLVGFLRENRCNIYHGVERILIAEMSEA